MFHKYLIGNLDQFASATFPQLEESLRQVVVLLATNPGGPKTEMILSFVKDHSIRSQQVKDYPVLAKLISTKTLPLHVMEELFESSKQNLLFRKQLEDYIRTYFAAKNL